jgi:hypothetical protein
VRFDLNDYSVPHTHVRKSLTVLAGVTQVRILDAQAVVASHVRSYDKGQQIELAVHVKDLVERKAQARSQRGMSRLRQAAPASQELLNQAGARGENLALGHAACQRGHSVLFTGAIEIINTLADAQASGSVKRVMHHYIKPEVLCIDELGYLPIDKFGADCLFQILSHRYERGATLITTNRIYKQWAGIFNNDAVLTSALLDRLLHHAETVTITGKSYRSKDQVEI